MTSTDLSKTEHVVQPPMIVVLNNYFRVLMVALPNFASPWTSHINTLNSWFIGGQSYTMNLSFRSNDPLDTVIINSSNGALLYHTETHNIIDKTTQINHFRKSRGSKPCSNTLGNVAFHSPKLHYRGQQIRIFRVFGFIKP